MVSCCSCRMSPFLALVLLACLNECGGNVDWRKKKNVRLRRDSYYPTTTAPAAAPAPELPTAILPHSADHGGVLLLRNRREVLPPKPPLPLHRAPPPSPPPYLPLSPAPPALVPQLQIWTPRCDVVRRSYRHSPECGHTKLPGIAERNHRAPAACLITGTGRAGTKFTSHLLHLLGWQVNHDSRWDFCPCPGKDGSVSHMYAFLGTQECPMPTGFSPGLKHMFLRVGLEIRGPLEYINSRAKDAWGKSHMTKSLPGFQDCNMDVPPIKTTPMAVQALHKWVLQNTFVGAYSDFVLDVDHFNDHPHRAVEAVCKHCALHTRLRTQRNLSNPSLFAEMGKKASMAWMEANRLEPNENLIGLPPLAGCPTKEQTKQIIDKLPSKENQNHTIHAALNWNDLAEMDKDMTTMAILVANAHGMRIQHVEPDVQGFVVRCGFHNHDPVHGYWTCFLDRDNKGVPPRSMPPT